MEGKGWFVVYGILLLAVVYLIFSVASISGKVNELQADVAGLKDQSATVEEVAPQPTPRASAAPSVPPNDLTTPAGRDAQRKQDLKTVTEAITAFREATGAYPAGLNELTPAYLERVPKDPSSPQFDYRYRRTDAGFVLTSVLEQGGDPDDVTGDGKADKIFTITERAQG